MKKRILFVPLVAVALLVFSQGSVSAQSISGSSYKNAAGLRVEFGSNWGTFAGLSYKHFFAEHEALEMQFLFGDHLVILEPEFQYHGDIPNAAGLKWYIGLGPGIAFGQGLTDVLLRPMVGLDYKISNVPLDFAFDWRPGFVVTHGSTFNAARFGFALRYTF